MFATFLLFTNIQVNLVVPKGDSTVYDLMQAPESLVIQDSTVFHIKRVGSSNKIRIYGKSLGRSNLKVDFGSGKRKDIAIEVIKKQKNSSWLKVKEYLEKETHLKIERNNNQVFIMGKMNDLKKVRYVFRLIHSLPDKVVPLFSMSNRVEDKVIRIINSKGGDKKIVYDKDDILFCDISENTPEKIKNELRFFFPNCTKKALKKKTKENLHYQFYFFSFNENHGKTNRLESMGFLKPLQLSMKGSHGQLHLKGADLLTWQSQKLSTQVRRYASPSLRVLEGGKGELKVGELKNESKSSLSLGGVSLNIKAQHIINNHVNTEVNIAVGQGIRQLLDDEKPHWESHSLQTSLSLPVNQTMVIGKINSLRHSTIVGESPFWNGVPFVGHLFQTDIKSATQQEIYIAVKVGRLKQGGLN